MKKFLFITLISALVLSTFSCNKDDDDKNSLAGTSWTYRGSQVTETYTFTTENSGICSWTESGKGSDSNPFTYTYTPPSVTITEEGYTEIGVIIGNVMSLYGDPYYKN